MNSGYFVWETIYRMNTVTPFENRLVYQDGEVSVRFLTGPMRFPFFDLPRYAPANDLRFIPKQTTVDLIGGYLYLSIQINRASKGDPSPDMSEATRRKARDVAALLAMCLGRNVVEELVHEGWRDSHGLLSVHSMEVVEPLELKGDVCEMAATALHALDQKPKDIQSRLFRALHWYLKGLAADDSTDQMICYWIALETYPMSNTSNIAPVSEHLAKILSIKPDEAKAVFDIGRLYGVRCKVVHDGESVASQAHGPMVTLTRVILEEIIRYELGFPSTGLLQRYMQLKADGDPITTGTWILGLDS